jgi:hypothetical protein
MTIHKAKGLEFPVVVVPDLGREGLWRAPVVLADHISGRLAVSLGRPGDTGLTTLDWADAEARETQRLDAEALRVLYVALTRAERTLVLPVPARPEGKGFYQHLAGLLGDPTDVMAADDLTPAARARAAAPPAAGETFEAWRARRRDLLGRARAAGDEGRPRSEDPGGGASTRAARLRAAAAQLARAALLQIDLGRSGDAPALIAALGSSRGVRPDVVAEAARLLVRALADPVIGRARRAPWLTRDVPVAVEVEGAVAEDRLDIVFEEEGELVVVRAGLPADGPSVGLPAEILSPALGRPIREVAILNLATP